MQQTLTRHNDSALNDILFLFRLRSWSGWWWRSCSSSLGIYIRLANKVQALMNQLCTCILSSDCSSRARRSLRMSLRSFVALSCFRRSSNFSSLFLLFARIFSSFSRRSAPIKLSMNRRGWKAGGFTALQFFVGEPTIFYTAVLILSSRVMRVFSLSRCYVRQLCQYRWLAKK